MSGAINRVSVSFVTNKMLSVSLYCICFMLDLLTGFNILGINLRKMYFPCWGGQTTFVGAIVTLNFEGNDF